MRHLGKTTCTLAIAACFASGVFAQGTSTGGAPPATHSGKSDTGDGRSAGIKGGGGTAGEYGTDPATMRKEQTARQQDAKGKQPDASGAAASK